MNKLKQTLHDIGHYPTAVAGVIVIFLLVVLAAYAMIKIPYNEAIRLWRGGEEVWYQNPKTAPPAWFNFFSAKKEPVSFAVKSGDTEGSLLKKVTPGAQNTSSIDFTYTFDFQYDYFPQEMLLYFTTTYKSKQPFVSVYLITPDQRKVRISDFGVNQKQTYRFSQDDKLQKRLKTDKVITSLFSVPGSNPAVPLKGQYQLLINGVTFEEGADINAEFVFHGNVYGLAGTDNQRRDLMVPLLWGAPIALAFGLLAAMGTAILTMIISAIGAWFGGLTDGIIQRVTEVNMVLPFLAILIMVGTFYSRSIWIILGVTIALSIFTSSIKTYRAIFMQVKESTYIEAAKAYGASNFRIIFQYMIPRIIPLLLPTLVSSVASYVFLEASLAVLGLGDPVLPTWGKIINDAEMYGALYKGLYYWILEPAVLLMLTGLAFAMLGFALDRIFNPKLRGL
ncbi:MAG: ABC transporter permease [Anaerolineaceae bacterium]|jgi:peptide/nickel transport system permease protein